MIPLQKLRKQKRKKVLMIKDYSFKQTNRTILCRVKSVLRKQCSKHLYQAIQISTQLINNN